VIAGIMNDRWALPKQTQLIDFANPNDRKAGDCWRCCVAAVVGVPATEVPHFLQIELDTRGTDRWKDCDRLTQEWLSEHGFAMARVCGYLNFDYLYNKPQPAIIKCGPTPRSRKMHQHHAVVFIGDKMVYDPHPDNTGLTAVVDQYLIMKFNPEA